MDIGILVGSIVGSLDWCSDSVRLTYSCWRLHIEIYAASELLNTPVGPVA